MGVEIDIISEKRSIALNPALKILEKWQCTDCEKAKLLALDFDSKESGVSEHTLERVSYILRIHKALRQAFGSDETIYNWVRKANNHPTLSGASAMDYMLSGNERVLSNVTKLVIGYSAP